MKQGTPLETGLYRLKMLYLQMSFNKDSVGGLRLSIDEVEAMIKVIEPAAKEQRLIETYCEEDIKAIREAFHNGQTHGDF